MLPPPALNASVFWSPPRWCSKRIVAHRNTCDWRTPEGAVAGSNRYARVMRAANVQIAAYGPEPRQPAIHVRFREPAVAGDAIDPARAQESDRPSEVPG